MPDFSPATAQRYEIIGTTQMKSIQIDSTTSKYKQKQPYIYINIYKYIVVAVVVYKRVRISKSRFGSFGEVFTAHTR